MKRREFITVFGGAAAAWPLAARAQQPAMPVIGFLHGGSPGPSAPFVSAFHKGLSAAGFEEGRDVEIAYRWAENQYDKLPAMAADLARRRVAVIVAGAPPAAPLAAKAATATIPIVFFSGSDPISAGFVASYNRPGGNATGVASISAELETKRLGILHELAPAATTIAYIVASFEQKRIAELQTAARVLGKQLLVLKATTGTELDDAFATVVQEKAGAVLVGTFAFLSQKGEQLAALAARFAIPMISFNREFTASGGLISYGTSRSESWRQIGVYAGRILKGEKPGDLPVVVPTKFELTINIRTAKALGLAVPPTLRALADEVIE